MINGRVTIIFPTKGTSDLLKQGQVKLPRPLCTEGKAPSAAVDHWQGSATLPECGHAAQQAPHPTTPERQKGRDVPSRTTV